ncbi:MerR family transcriptional regulator [Dictyobacter aurantiacus]|uniref:HTH-type transcriptional regulator YfmP n=1 Tax=Dictyobacter aurantiacus TaxID=1936993 RepID=A0A401Z9Y5_9CHLR|nr:MerR family transcriptional regulator [Dictyobacter aurantiacus]GCE03681.1 HTH-type transcriptional regulator YfmP [Dictyobacter aurantiacus]
MTHPDDEEPDPNTTTQNYYSIEQVATRAQLTKRTLRYYEEMGLLPQAERTEGNYRRYTEEDLQRIMYIKSLRELMGFSLSEIRKFLQAEDEREQERTAFRQGADTQQKLRHLDRSDEIIREQLVLIEQKMNGLKNMQQQLYERLEMHARKRQTLQEEGS